MEILKKINYLLNKRSKQKIGWLLILIIIGSFAELLGVSILLPIIDLSMDGSDYTANNFCKVIIHFTGTSDKKTVLLCLIGSTIAIYILKNLYLAAMYSYLYKTAAEVKRELSTKLLKSYLKQPYSYFLYKNSSELIRSVNEDTGQFYQVILNILRVVTNGVTALALIVYLAIENFAMTITVAILVGLSAVVIFLGVQKKTAKLGKMKQKHSSSLIQYMQQSIEGIKEIKLLSTEQYFVSQYDKTYYKQTDVERKYNVLNWLPKYMIETVCIAGIMGFMGINIMYNVNYAALIPQLAVFAAGAFKLLPAVNGLYSYMNTIVFFKASVDLLYHDVKDTEKYKTNEEEIHSEITELPFSKKVEVKNAVFHYQNVEKNVLDQVNMEIEKGTSVALIGASGGGKTTMADIVLGFLSLQSGTVEVDGVDIQTNIRGWRKNIGYIPQNIYLTDDTIRNNIAFGIPKDQINDTEVWRALEEAQLKDFVESLPEGLDTEVGERGVRISGGQRQRIGIARALYRNPSFLVFDEATSALDNDTEKEVMKAIDSLHGNKTMLMIAHRLSTIENCDHVYKVENGKVEKVR